MKSHIQEADPVEVEAPCSEAALLVPRTAVPLCSCENLSRYLDLCTSEHLSASWFIVKLNKLMQGKHLEWLKGKKLFSSTFTECVEICQLSDDFPTVSKILQLSGHQLHVLQLSFDTNSLELVQIP